MKHDLDDEHYRVEIFKDSDEMAKDIKVPMNIETMAPRPQNDCLVQLGDEEVRLPAYFSNIEDAEHLVSKIGVPDGHCIIIMTGEWGPGITFEEMEEDEMPVEEALEWAMWEPFEIVRVYLSNA